MSLQDDLVKDSVFNLLMGKSIIKDISNIYKIMKILGSIYTSFILFKMAYPDTKIDFSIESLINNILDGTALTAFLCFVLVYFVIYNFLLFVFSGFYKSSFSKNNITNTEIESVIVNSIYDKTSFIFLDNIDLFKEGVNLQELKLETFDIENKVVSMFLIVLFITLQLPYVVTYIKIIVVLILLIFIYLVFPYFSKIVFLYIDKVDTEIVKKS